METLKLIGYLIILATALALIYQVAKRNTDYKRNQRNGTLPQHYDTSSRR